MKRRFAFPAQLAIVLVAAAGLHAQQASPRDLWPQVTQAARDGDFDEATRRATSMVATGRTSGIRTFPLYASAATGLASESDRENRELANWASKTAGLLDGASPSVAFGEAERAARRSEWPTALRFVAEGFVKMIGNYRTNLLGRANLLIVASLALSIAAIFFAIALLVRYGRSMAHDFREILGNWLSGGTVSVLAFALLFLPLFLWLGPVWLVFYWFAIFFAYAGVVERIIIAILGLLIALLPVAIDWTASRIAGVESPVVMAAVASQNQAYHPEALRRLQELIAVVPDHATLQLLVGNMQSFEGNDDQAAQHYRRAIELRQGYAGAHVNLGNLFFLNNEFQAAMTEYEKAQSYDSDLAIAYYNASVASGETYKFDQQAKMLERAREADRSFVERLTRTPPSQKIVMYSPPVDEAWSVTDEMAKRPAARALFGNYASFDFVRSALTPVSLGALLSLLLAVFLWIKRRRPGLANACIKCGRTFCHRCKSSRESATYCTQCIHIYLKRDGVSLDTKRQKLEEVTEHQGGMTKRNRLFATFMPGSAQMMEGRTITGVIGTFVFAALVVVAIFVGRLAPALGPVADFSQTLVRGVAITLAIIVWLILSLPVYRRRSAA